MTTTSHPVPTRNLFELPKGHLHVHLEGAMRPSTLEERANNYGIPMPAIRGYGSFAAFSDMYMAACEVLRTPDDMRRLVFEVVEDAAADGAVWVEPSFYAPRYSEQFGSMEAVVEVVLEASADAAAKYSIGAGTMIAADRTVDPVEAVDIAHLGVALRNRGIVSFGLANDEALWPPEPFAAAFDVARAGGLLSTPHAGELAGPASIVGALDVLGADRIQHGVRAVEDPVLVERLAASSVCLDVCPSSNVMLGVYPSLAEHPLPALIAAGVRCSLNGDDPLLFGPGLLDEYELARNQLGLDDESLAFVARCSIDASGAPQAIKDSAQDAIDRWLLAEA